MHIVLKFQIFISIFTMVKLQKKTPKIFKWGKMGVFMQLFQSNVWQHRLIDFGYLKQSSFRLLIWWILEKIDGTLPVHRMIQSMFSYFISRAIIFWPKCCTILTWKNNILTWILTFRLDFFTWKPKFSQFLTFKNWKIWPKKPKIKKLTLKSQIFTNFDLKTKILIFKNWTILTWKTKNQNFDL